MNELTDQSRMSKPRSGAEEEGRGAVDPRAERDGGRHEVGRQPVHVGEPVAERAAQVLEKVMPWAAPRMTAYDLPIDESLRPDVASRAVRSVVGAAGLSASGRAR